MKRYVSSRARLGLALGCASAASIGLFGVGALHNDSWDFAYLIYNLALAWIPLVLTLWLERILRVKLWSSWQALVVTALWIGFLPNSFYMVVDYIHLQEVPRVDLLYDAIMFTAFIMNAMIIGYISLYVVHQELRQRLSTRLSAWLVGLIFLVCSFAIYVGRELRWNTWDVITNPFSMLFDISDRLLNLDANPRLLSTTLSLFVLLGSLYLVVWHIVRAVQAARPKE